MDGMKRGKEVGRIRMEKKEVKRTKIREEEV